MTPNIKVFLDTANVAEMETYFDRVSGFTTNPTLMKRAGVVDYLEFARVAIRVASGKPISFEVLGDDRDAMIRQARLLSGLGPEVYVKIPIKHLDGKPTTPVIATLLADGIRVNVTAICQAVDIKPLVGLFGETPAIVSVFSGRIADTGRDPRAAIAGVRGLLGPAQHVEILWASTREVYNIVEAAGALTDIITMPPALVDKLAGLDKDLATACMEVIRQFDADAKAAGYTLEGGQS